MAGTLTEAEVLEQLKHNEDVFLDGASGTDVGDDLDERVATANATHDEVTNEELATELNSTTVDLPHLHADVYTGGNVVAPVNSTWMEDRVREALDGDEIFHTGGAYTSNYVPLSPYWDPLWVLEAQKLTGETLI